MKIKDLAKLCKELTRKGYGEKDVAVGMWTNQGRIYYSPHFSCSGNVGLGSHSICIGYFDNCLAHMVEDDFQPLEFEMKIETLLEL